MKINKSYRLYFYSMTKSYIDFIQASEKLTVYFVVKILSPIVDIILIIVLGVVDCVDMIKNI